MSDNKNVISFPRRTAIGETKPVQPNVWIERFGMWNYFLITWTVVGSIVVSLAAILFNILGLM